MTSAHKQYQQFNTWNEILSQPTVWSMVLAELDHSIQIGRILEANGKTEQSFFIGCGTSFYLAEAAAASWSLLTGQPARALPASEVLLYPELLHGKTAQAIVISRSGQTSEAVRAAGVLRSELSLPTVGITCAKNSDLEHACDETIILRAADEQSMVMTRSFTSMLLALQFLAARLANNAKFIEDLHATAEQFASRISPLSDDVHEFLAHRNFADYVFLGQGPFHGIAREAALKVMEMSTSYSQFFHTLEFRHGPKAIVNPSTCLTFFLSNTGYKAEAEVLEEMKELGGINIAICNRADDTLRQSSDLLIEMDSDASELVLLPLYIVPCQLLGFFIGIAKGLNPDVPKNLSRVVILD